MANPSAASGNQAAPAGAAAAKPNARNGRNNKGKGAMNATNDAVAAVVAKALSATEAIDSMKAKALAQALTNGGAKAATAEIANGVAASDTDTPVMSYSNKLKSKINGKKTDAADTASLAAKEDAQARVTPPAAAAAAVVENGGGGGGEVSSRVTPPAGTSRVSDVEAASNGNTTATTTTTTTTASPASAAGEHSKLNGDGHSNSGPSPAAATPALPAQRSRGRNRCRKRNGNKTNATDEGIAAAGGDGAAAAPLTNEASANERTNGNGAVTAVSNGNNQRRHNKNAKSTGQQKAKQTQAKKDNSNKPNTSPTNGARRTRANPATNQESSEDSKATASPIESQIISTDENTSTSSDVASDVTSSTSSETTEQVPTGVTAAVARVQLNPLACEFKPRSSTTDSGPFIPLLIPGHDFATDYRYTPYPTLTEDYTMQPWSQGPDSSNTLISSTMGGRLSYFDNHPPAYCGLPEPIAIAASPSSSDATTSGHNSGTVTPLHQNLYQNPPNTPATTSSQVVVVSSSSNDGAGVVPPQEAPSFLANLPPASPSQLPDDPALYMYQLSRRLETHAQLQTPSQQLLTLASVTAEAECREGYYVEEQPPAASSTISPAQLPDTASVAGAEDTEESVTDTVAPLLETASSDEASNTPEALPVADVEGASGDLSLNGNKMEACLENKTPEAIAAKKESLTAAVTDTTSPAADSLKSSSSTSSPNEVVTSSNGVAEDSEVSELPVADMSPETSPEMAPLPDQPAAAASSSSSSLSGAAVTPQTVSPAAQGTTLPNGEAGAEAAGDPATEAILKALTPPIQNLFNLKTFTSHPQLKEHLDGELYVAASHLLQIAEFQAVTSSLEVLTQALRNNPSDVEFDDTGNRVRCRNKRNVVIVRELSNTEYTKEDIKSIFDSDDGSCPEVLHVEYANFSCWYIYFASENDAVTSLCFLNNRRFKGRSIQAGIKSSQPTARVPYTPVKPNLPNSMGGAMAAQHQGPGGAQGLVSGGPPPGGMYVGRPLPISSGSGVMPQQQQAAPVAAVSGSNCQPPSSMMFPSHNSGVMHNTAAIYPSPYYNIPQPTLFYPSPMMQHYNPTAHAATGFMDLQQFVSFNGLNPTNTFKPTSTTQLQRFNSNINVNNNGNKSRNRSRDSGQRTPASNTGPPTPQGGYVPQPNARLFGPQSAASSPGGLQQQPPLPYTSQPHNTNNSTLHYTNAYHPHMPGYHHQQHHHHQQQHPAVSMAASVIPPASSSGAASSSSATFHPQDPASIPPHHASSNTSANSNGPTTSANSNSPATQYNTNNTTLISSSTSSNNINNNANNTSSNNGAPSPTSSNSLLREDSARSSPVHLNNSRNKTNNTPPLLGSNTNSSDGRAHNANAPLISHPPLISQDNAPLMAIPPQSLHANAQNMPSHKNRYNNNMHYNSHHNNQRYLGQPGTMHHRNYPAYLYQPNHFPMQRDVSSRSMGGRNSSVNNAGGNSGRNNRGRQQRSRDEDSHYHPMSGGGNAGGQMSGGHHQQHHGGQAPRMGGAPGARGNNAGGPNGASGSNTNSANNNSASGAGNSQQSLHLNDASNNSSNNNNVANNNSNNSRGNNSNGSRNQQSDRAAQHSSHDSRQAQFALESTSFPPLPGADEAESSPTTVTDEAAPAAAVAQVPTQAVSSESVTTPRANFAWGADVSSTTNGQRFSDIMKKPRSEVAATPAAPSSKDESVSNVTSCTDAPLNLAGTPEAAPAVVTAAAIVASNTSSATTATSELVKTSNSTAAEVVAAASTPTNIVDTSSSVVAGPAAPKSANAAAKDQQPQDVAAPNRPGNNGAAAKEQRARGGRNRRGDNAQQQQPKSFNKNGNGGGSATGSQGKSQQQPPKQSTGNVQTSATAKATNVAVSTPVPSTTPASSGPASTAAPVATPAVKDEKNQEAGTNKELGDDDGWITKKTKEPRTHRNDRKNTGGGHNSHRGGYGGGGDYHGERREERAYYGRGQPAYKERDTNRDTGSDRHQPMLNGNTSPPPAQRQPTTAAASATAPSKGKPVKSNTEAEAATPSVNAKDSSSSVPTTTAATVSAVTVAPPAAAVVAAAPATTATSAASTVVASPPAESGEHVKTWANVAGQGSKKIVQTAAVQSQLERKSKDLAMQEKEKERRAAAVRAPRGSGVSRGSERGGYGGRGSGGRGGGGNGFVGSSSAGRGQRRPDFRGGEGSSYRGGRGGDRSNYNRDNKDDHQAGDATTKRESVQQYRESAAAAATPTAATARAK